MLGKREDYILVKEFTYPTGYETSLPIEYQFAGVRIDDLRLLPEDLYLVLTNWNKQERNSQNPRLLYTIPYSQNPSGATQPTKRRHKIYAVAQKHDL